MNNETIGKIDLVSTGTATDLEAMAKPIVGINTNTSPIARTAAIVGSRPVYGPAANATVNVLIKKDAAGNIKFHTDKKGNKYCWVDITLSEVPTVVTGLQLSHEMAKCETKVNLNTVDTGSSIELHRNWRGNFGRVYTTSEIVRYELDDKGKVKMTKVKGEQVTEGVSPKGNKTKVVIPAVYEPKVKEFHGARSRIIFNHAPRETWTMVSENKYDLLNESEKITNGNVSLVADPLKFDGYRVTVYEKEDGIEITTSVPSKKGERAEWVDKYTGYMGWMAKRLIPAIEYAFILESGIVPKKRAFSASCSQCSQCYTRVYGQNQEQPAVGCSISVHEELEFDFHWEMELYKEGMVALPSGIYLMHSEQVDDITCLPASPFHHTSPTASNRGRVGYEIPSWFSSTQKANDVIEALSIELMRESTKGLPKDVAMRLVKHYTKVYDIKLPANIFEDEDTESVQYGLARFDSGFSITDMADNGMLEAEDDEVYMEDDEAITTGGSMIVELAPEMDVLPDMDVVKNLMANVHPLIKRLMLEETVTPEELDKYPGTVQLMQDFMLAEPSPRMIKACKTEEYMKDKFDKPACLWFSYKGSRKQAYGSAAFNAMAEMQAPARRQSEFETHEEKVLVRTPASERRDLIPGIYDSSYRPREIKSTHRQQEYKLVSGVRVPVIG